MNTAAEMPRYKSHKIVHALKLERIEYMPPEEGASEGIACFPALKSYAMIPILKGEGMTRFPSSAEGDDAGYLVVYADGYRSWSPTKAFEEGYKRIDIPSDDDDRANVMRQNYRQLDESEGAKMVMIKELGASFYDYVETIGASRELSLAKTKIEEAVMWAVKHITR